MSLPVIELGDVALYPREQELWLQIAERQSVTTWMVAEAQAAVVYLQTWIAEQEGKTILPDCRCGHPAAEHVTGLCLSTLDCLCRGFQELQRGCCAGAQEPEDRPAQPDRKSATS